MSKLMLSIKPKFVKAIFDGTKKFEFRTREPQKKVDEIIIYETTPMSMVVGSFKVKAIHVGTPQEISKLTRGYTGLTGKEYWEYYRSKDKAVAYEIGELVRFEEAKPLSDYGVKTAPQSYVYVD